MASEWTAIAKTIENKGVKPRVVLWSYGILLSLIYLTYLYVTKNYVAALIMIVNSFVALTGIGVYILAMSSSGLSLADWNKETALTRMTYSAQTKVLTLSALLVLLLAENYWIAEFHKSADSIIYHVMTYLAARAFLKAIVSLKTLRRLTVCYTA